MSFRDDALKERVEAVRPKIQKAREITEKADSEKREMTADEKAFVEPVLKTAREIADGMKKARDDAAMMKPIGLAIKGRFDLDTEFGKSDYRNTKGRRVSGLSIGYAIRHSTRTAAGHELTDLQLIEVPIVARGANDSGSGRA